MPEWWTYAPGDFLMYSPRVYARLVDAYQRDVWPAQLAALALGVAVASLARSRVAWRGRATVAMAAAGWAWVAWAFLAQRYATINWAATYFAYAFAAQAGLLLVVGAVRGTLVPDVRNDGAARGAYALLLFALFVWPVLGGVSRDGLAALPLAGVLPDPTAVATLGLVLVMRGRARWTLLAIPLLWCAVSGVLLWAQDSWLAVALLGAGAFALVLAVAKRAARRSAGGVLR